MLAMLMSSLFFILLLYIGNVLMILNETAYVLIPLFIVSLLLCRLFYKDGNCRSLEVRDFVIALAMVGIFLAYYEYRKELIDAATISYLYLSTFLAVILYADSVRFKSLM